MNVYDPFTGRYEITDDWQGHLDRGSSGGIDYAMATGTGLPAVSDGVIQNVPNYGTGGNTVRLLIDADTFIEYMHLSGFALPSGTRVVQGTIIGYAGMSGSATGPHLHIHAYVNGVRVDFRTLITVVPIKREKEDEMKDKGLLRNSTNGDIFAVFTIDGKTYKSHLDSNAYNAWVSAGVGYYANVSSALLDSITNA